MLREVDAGARVSSHLAPSVAATLNILADHHRLSDVYGISRDLPLNYVPRDGVDGVFVESLTRDKHIVVYGSSKQGKTSLRKYNLTTTSLRTTMLW